MLTIENLREYGANIEEGLTRCMNNEDFYLRMVGRAVSDDGFTRLQEALAAGDLKGAFEAAHALKGMLGNLALTPVAAPASELTELLRAQEDGDYGAYLEQILGARDALAALAES